MLPLLSGILAEAICTNIGPEFRVPTGLFLLFAHDHSTKIYGLLTFNLLLWTTIRLKIKVFIDLLFLFPHDYSTKLYGPILFILSLCKNIRLKIRVFINLFIFICTRHSTIVRAHSYSLIHSFLICANIVFTIFMAVLPLYFVHSVSGSTDFMFRPLYS